MDGIGGYIQSKLDQFKQAVGGAAQNVEQGVGQTAQNANYGFWHSPVGQGLVGAQNFLQSPQSANIAPQLTPFSNQNPIGRLGNTAANIPGNIANTIVSQGVINPALDIGRLAGARLTGQNIPSYGTLKSAPARLAYNVMGMNATPQQVIGNVAGTAIPPLTAYGGGKVFGIGTNAIEQGGQQGILQAIKSGAANGAQIGGIYGVLNGLASGRNSTLQNQFTQAGIQGAAGVGTGAALGGVSAGAGNVIGKVQDSLSNFLQQKYGTPDNEATGQIQQFARDELGRFTKGQLPNSNEPVYYGDLRQQLGLPVNTQAGFVNFGAKIGEDPAAEAEQTTPSDVANPNPLPGAANDAEKSLTPETVKQYGSDLFQPEVKQKLINNLQTATDEKPALDQQLGQVASQAQGDFDSRLKEPDTVLQKIILKRSEGRVYGPDDVNDLYGGRITITSPDQADTVGAGIKQLVDSGKINITNAEPVTKDTYHAFHIDFTTPQGTSGEIQVMTPQESAESLVNHGIRAQYGESPPPAVDALKDQNAQAVSNLPNGQAAQVADTIQTQNQANPEQSNQPLSIEQIIEKNGGWQPGVRAQFDQALYNKDAATVSKLLPQVPQDYQNRFADQISQITGTPPGTPPGSPPVANPTDPYFNVNRYNLPPEQQQAMADNVNSIKGSIKNITGETLTNQQVIDQAQTSNKILTQTVGQQQTADYAASLLKARQQLAEMQQTGQVTPEYLDTLTMVKSQATDIARKLQSFSINADPVQQNSMNQIVQAVLKTGASTDDVLNAAQGVNFNNPQEAASFYRQFVQPTAGNWLDLIRYNSMLSSPQTLSNIASGNLINSAVVQPIVKTATGLVDYLTPGDQTHFAGEGPAYVHGYFSSLHDAASNFADVLSGSQNAGMVDVNNIPPATEGVGGVVANGLNFFSRLHNAFYQFFNTMATGGESEALSYKLSQTGEDMSAQDFGNQAQQGADYSTYKQGLLPQGQGNVLNAMDQVIGLIKQAKNADNPYLAWPAKFVFPFLNIANNMTKQGIEFSPAGFSTMIGAGDKTTQFTKALLGTGAFLSAAMVANSGNATWAQPTGAKEKQAFIASGRLPYSVNIGGNWVTYDKLPPAMGIPLAMAAAFTQAQSNNTYNKNFWDTALTTIAASGKYMSDQSYVKNFGDLIKTIQGDPSTPPLVTAANYGQQLIPMRAFMGWLARVTDPLQRQIMPGSTQVQKVIQTYMQQIPFLREQTQPVLSQFGQPVPNTNALINNTAPVHVMPANPQGESQYQGVLQTNLLNRDVAAAKAQTAQGQAQANGDSLQGLGKDLGGGIHQLGPNKFFYQTTDATGNVGTGSTKTLLQAQQAVDKANFASSNQTSQLLHGVVYYQQDQGDGTTLPKAIKVADLNPGNTQDFTPQGLEKQALAQRQALELVKASDLINPQSNMKVADALSMIQQNGGDPRLAYFGAIGSLAAPQKAAFSQNYLMNQQNGDWNTRLTTLVEGHILDSTTTAEMNRQGLITPQTKTALDNAIKNVTAGFGGAVIPGNIPQGGMPGSLSMLLGQQLAGTGGGFGGGMNLGLPVVTGANNPQGVMGGGGTGGTGSRSTGKISIPKPRAPRLGNTKPKFAKAKLSIPKIKATTSKPISFPTAKLATKKSKQPSYALNIKATPSYLKTKKA